MELVKGQIVISRAGRDVNHCYIVLGQSGERVLLANGAKRTLAAPKQKNMRHIVQTNIVLPENEAETDAAVKKALAAFELGQRATTQGG